MTRAPFQVLVLPYRITGDGTILYAIFKRRPDDGDYWQGIAGGGEDDETPLEAARREAGEEAGIRPDSEFFKLDSFSTVPVVGVCGFKWGQDVLVLPQHFYAVKVDHEKLRLSGEHAEYGWLDYESAYKLLHWQSNKNALWELDYRLRRKSGKAEP